MRCIRTPVILVLASALISSPAVADRVLLKNGQVYEGDILEKTDTYIHLRTDSEKLRIYRADIDSILGEKRPPIESETETEDWQHPPSDTASVVLKTPPTAEADETVQKAVSGRIVELTIEHVILETESGIRTISLSRIASVERGNGRLLMLVDAVSEGEEVAKEQTDEIEWFMLGCVFNVIGVGAAFLAKPGPPPQEHLIGKPPEYVEAFTNAFEKKWKSAHRAPAMAGFLSSTAAAGGCVWILTEINRSLEEIEPAPDLSGWSCPGPY